MPVFPIRTFLDSTMVTPRQRDRMAVFRLSKEARVSADDSPTHDALDKRKCRGSEGTEQS